MNLLAAFVVVLAGFAGVALTVFTLPGIWLTLAVAAACELWRPDLFSWWLLLALFVLAVAAEIADLFASAIGAARAGGTRRASLGSLVGGLIGAIAGTPLIPVPVLGTMLGAAVGAGIGALLLEYHGGEKTWGQSARIGGGAAIGRFTAGLLKIVIAAIIAAVLSAAALWSAIAGLI